MPPGKALAEVLLGRSSPLNRLLRAGKPVVQRQAAKQQISHVHTSPATHSHAASAVQRSSGGRLVDAIVGVFSPLVRAPGVPARGTKAVESAHKVVGRIINARAGYHTLSGASRARSSGFGSLRPNALPRGTNNSMGLQSARNFSSSRTVFENVVHNAPLGLRVLGDKDRLDMTRFKREMRAAFIKKQKMQCAHGKGKGKATFDPFTLVKSIPSAFDAYFPVAPVSASDAVRASVQLLLPLNPVNEATPFLSYSEEAEDSRFFSAMLMSDLRLLSEMHGAHHARLRQVIERLELAGCFEPDPLTGEILVKAELDETQGRVVVTFYSKRWTMADVKQVLGLYDGSRRQAWFKLVDLGDSAEDCSPVPSTIPSDFEGSLSSSAPSSSGTSVASFDDLEEHDRVIESLIVPDLESLHTVHDSYVWGVNDFIDGLNASQRPSFVSL